MTPRPQLPTPCTRCGHREDYHYTSRCPGGCDCRDVDDCMIATMQGRCRDCYYGDEEDWDFPIAGCEHPLCECHGFTKPQPEPPPAIDPNQLSLPMDEVDARKPTG